MNGISRLLLVCGLVFVPLFASQANPQPIPASPQEAYIHRSTQFKFPPRVGAFQRGDVVQYDNEGKDISAAYRFDPLHISATVYVYPTPPIPEPKLKMHFEACKAAILAHPQAQVTDEGPFQAADGGRIHRGLRVAFTFPSTDFRAFEKGEILNSELYLFPFKEGWSVKFRITYPKSQEKAAASAIQTLANGFSWP